MSRHDAKSGSAIRRLARGLALVAGVAGAVAALATVVLMTPPGGWLAARLIETLVSNDRQTLRLDGVSAPLAHTVMIDGMTLRSPDGENLVTAEAIRLSLSFADLWRARLTVHELEIGSATLIGLPEPAAEPAQASLPIGIALEAFAVRSLEVRHPVLDVPARLTLQGSAALLRDDMSGVELEIRPEERTAGSVDGLLMLAASLDPQTGSIAGRLTLEDSEDRAFAAMLALPDAGRLGLEGRIAGDAGTWTLDLQGMLDDLDAMVLSVTRVSAGEDRYVAQGKGSFSPFAPRIVAPLLAGPTSISADIRHQATTGHVAIDMLALENEALSLSAEGSVTADAASTLRAGLELKRSTFLPVGQGVSIAPLSASLTMDGTAKSAGLRAVVDGAGLSMPGLELQRLSFELTGSGFDLMEMRGALDIRAGVAKTGASDLRLASLLANGVNAQMQLAIDGSAWSLAQPLSIETGTAKATLAGSGATDLATLDLDLEASVRTAILDPALEARLGRSATLRADIVKADDRVTLDQVSATAGPLRLTKGRLAADAGTVEGFANIAVSSLSQAGAGLDGVLGADVTVSGTPASLVAAFDTSATVRAPGGGELPLRATGEAAFGAQGLSVTRVDASFAGNSLRGSLFAGRTDDGVAFDLPNPGVIAALFGERLEGAVSGAVRPLGSRFADGFTLTLSSRQLAHVALGVSNASISATYDPQGAQRALTGTVKAESIDVAGRRLTDLDAALESGAGDSPVTLSVSAMLDGMPLSATGTVQSENGLTRVQLGSASATIEGRRLALTAPATISLDSGGSLIDAPAIGVSGGQVALTGQFQPTLDINATLRGVPLDVVRIINPAVALDGTVSGRVTASGRLPSPAARYELAFSGLSLPQMRAAGLPPLAVAASGGLEGQTLTLDARITGVDGLDLRASGGVRLDAGPQLDLKLSGPVPVGIARERLAASGLSVTGNTALDLTVRGRADAPALSGAVRMRDGRIVSLAAALDLRDVAADFNLQDDRLTVARFTGSIATGGTVSVGGAVGLSPGAGFPADLTVAVRDGRYLDGRNIAARFNADLTLSGPLLRDPLVAGEIDLASVAITVPDSLPRAITTLNIERRNASRAVSAQDVRLAGKPNDASGGVRLAVAVSAPSGIVVRGRGIDAELGGALRLEGRSSAPRAVGGFELRRGALDLLGRKLRFTEGTLTFTGSLTPVADLLASAQAQSSTVSVRAAGPVDALEFTFASVPSLPEEEVLALLVFGRSFSNLSPLQIAQLAQSVAQLTGIARGPGVLERLTRAAGLDSVDVDTDEATGSTAVRVGKALNERTQVSVLRPAHGRASTSISAAASNCVAKHPRTERRAAACSSSGTIDSPKWDEAMQPARSSCRCGRATHGVSDKATNASVIRTWAAGSGLWPQRP
ncbi:MAG: translocation/assembly module TamB domain-containing protein [Rhizobiaceae bacterium]|nr:translocation/assembly module TamB domain-containing protein [Rhizobiaceae bacterium]